MIISKIAPEPSKVTDKIAFCGRLLPNLGLACRGEFPFRAYVLKCAGPRPNSPCFYYVGITWAGNIAKRMIEHFVERNGPPFTKANRPLGVEFVFPAATAATEALVITPSGFS